MSSDKERPRVNRSSIRRWTYFALGLVAFILSNLIAFSLGTDTVARKVLEAKIRVNGRETRDSSVYMTSTGDVIAVTGPKELRFSMYLVKPGGDNPTIVSLSEGQFRFVGGAILGPFLDEVEIQRAGPESFHLPDWKPELEWSDKKMQFKDVHGRKIEVEVYYGMAVQSVWPFP